MDLWLVSKVSSRVGMENIHHYRRYQSEQHGQSHHGGFEDGFGLIFNENIFDIAKDERGVLSSQTKTRRVVWKTNLHS